MQKLAILSIGILDNMGILDKHQYSVKSEQGNRWMVQEIKRGYEVSLLLA